MRHTSAAVGLCMSALAAPALAASLAFERVAVDGGEGVGFIDAAVRPALAADGTVVFAGTDQTGDVSLWSWDGALGPQIDLSPDDFTDVLSVQVRSAGDIALLGRRTVGGDNYQGVYRTTTAGAALGTIRETVDTFMPVEPVPRPNVAMSETGIVTFSTIDDAAGAIYRGPITGPVTELRQGSGIFYNTQDVDINDAGDVAVQMEYGDPTKGLSRGILIFDTPGDTLDTITTAIEKTDVGTQPRPSLNNAGQVAFALNNPVSLTFYNPPDDASGDVVAVLNLAPGIYVSTPQPFGQPSVLTRVVDDSTGYSSFGRVQINDDGLFAFEAAYAGESGVFLGQDPIEDRVLLTGDPVGPSVWSVVRLGEINSFGDYGQLTLVTSVFGGDQEVWRVTIVPTPSTGALGAALGLALLRRRREGRGG